ncbi:acid protease [Trematosphaeria pertusa]|uniref:Acid protease n=1 Tax=Trematosphaeria pertusa TaxID=390896 RepID=A0A6A6II71_9PLEO|nr:acid protease [Trematosphaeria pertusa]KAF2250274.1 acid protease [Trematosphaeria pertusa]
MLFTTNISIGTPPQPFIACVDINWSDLFVPSSSCMLDPDMQRYCSPFRKFNSTQSSTHVPASAFEDTQYEFLWARGYLAHDTVHIAQLQISNQTFEDAAFWRSQYRSGWAPIDTGLGLARSRPRESRDRDNTAEWGSSILQNLKEQGALQENIFSLQLPRADEELGNLVLGGSDLQRGRQSRILTLPLTNKSVSSGPRLSFLVSSGWQANISSMSLHSSINNQAPLDIDLKGGTAIFSNWHDFISVSPPMAERILTYLHLSDLYPDPPCSQISDLPNLTLGFGDVGKITLTPSQYTVRVKSVYRDDEDRCVIPFTDWAHDGLREEGEKFVVLGTAVLQNLITEFDLDKETISFSARDD